MFLARFLYAASLSSPGGASGFASGAAVFGATNFLSASASFFRLSFTTSIISKSQPYKKSMKQKTIVYVMLVACFFLASCKNTEEKSAKSTDPVDIIETLSNDISQLSDEWTKEQ